jgi:small subunit ribosomal protein S1
MQMLDEYDYEQPRRGDFLEAVVLQIDGEYAIHLDIGGKSDAIITQEELERTPPEMLENLKAGDVITVYVVKGPSTTDKTEVSIRKAVEQEDWRNAEADMKSETLLDLVITGDNKGGLLVNYGRLQGFIPNSLVPALGRGGNQDQLGEIKQNMIGQSIKAQIIEVESGRHRLILSGRAAQKELRKDRLDQLEIGQTITGRVVNVVEYGVFVNLDGVDGLVHISELDHRHIEHPSEVCAPGDAIEVQVISIDHERERVGLSRKATQPVPDETMQELQENFS